MATYQIKSTQDTPVTVIYPAERLSGHNAVVRFRVGKKTTLPAYTAANLPHLVQFHVGQRIIMFLLADILETSYWQKVRNAYTWRGQLDIAADVRVDANQTDKVIQWLNKESAARGINFGRQQDSLPDPELVAG